MAVTLFTQINTLTAGLAKFNALLMIPVYQSFWIMFSVLGGMIYFQEYKDLNPTQTGFFILGMVITYSGVIYLLKERSRGGAAAGSYERLTGEGDELDGVDEDDDSEGDEENADGSVTWLTRREIRGQGGSPGGIELKKQISFAGQTNEEH
jgi:hypothetical protein